MIQSSFGWLRIGGVYESFCVQLLRGVRRGRRNVTTAPIINLAQPIIPTLPRYKSEAYFEKLEMLPTIHVHSTANNTICTITDNKGKVLGWASAVSLKLSMSKNNTVYYTETATTVATYHQGLKGTVGFKKARRGTSFAAQVVGVATAKKTLGFGIDKVNIRVKGFTQGRTGVLQGLSKGGLNVAAITDCTPISWGGCRPRKVRRV